LFKGAGIDLNVDPRVIAAILLAFFAYVNYRGVEISGRVQNAFVFFFWGATAIWMLMMFQNGSFENFVPEALRHMPAFKEFMMVVTWVWWCFAGFETAVGMGGEVRYPQINIPRSMTIVPFIILSVNGLLQWFLVALVPYEQHTALATAAAPFAEGLTSAGYVGFPIILLCAALAFGGDLSTMNPGVAGPARYIYQMGQDGVLPRFFGKIHPKFKTPFVSVIATALLTYLLIITNSIVWIATLSMCSLFWVYIIGFLSFYRLRRKEPELSRPYKAPCPLFALVSSIIFYLVMMWSMGWFNIGLSFIITGVALLYYAAWARTHSITYVELKQRMEKESALLEEDIPSPNEKRKMDKEYRRWKSIALAAACVTVVLYIVAFLA
ncbi:MAG: APC family permease, partial [Eubacteriales bacterium]|nr:APC family permease [Eubacteriales bacterium]